MSKYSIKLLPKHYGVISNIYAGRVCLTGVQPSFQTKHYSYLKQVNFTFIIIQSASSQIKLHLSSHMV